MNQNYNNQSYGENKDFNQARPQNSEKFPFSSAREVAMLATKNGMTVPDFMRLYMDNLYEAEQNAWYTAARFKATIIAINRKKTSKLRPDGKPQEKVMLTYTTPKQGATEIALAGLIEQDNDTYNLAKKCLDYKGKEVLLYRAYLQERYSVIIDVELIQKVTEE